MRLVATRSCFAAILTSQPSLTKSARSQVSASHQHTEHWAGFSLPLKSEPHPSPHESTHPSRRLAAPMAAASLKLSSSAKPLAPAPGSHLLPLRAHHARPLPARLPPPPRVAVQHTAAPRSDASPRTASFDKVRPAMSRRFSPFSSSSGPGFVSAVCLFVFVCLWWWWW